MDYLKMNKMILSDPKRRARLAHHEAAHYITYLAYCKRYSEFPHVVGLSIKPTNTKLLGFVTSRPLVWFAGEDKDKIECEIKHYLAGVAADYLFLDQLLTSEDWFCEFIEDSFHEPQTDIGRAWHYLGFIDDIPKLDSADIDDLFEGLSPYFQKTITDVEKYWPLITETANTLLDKTEFTPVELEELNDVLTERILIKSIFD